MISKNPIKDNDINKNLVLTSYQWEKHYVDILDFTVFTENGEQFTLASLFDKVLDLEANLKELKAALKEYEDINKKVDKAFYKAQDIMSEKITSLEIDVWTLKDKTQYL